MTYGLWTHASFVGKMQMRGEDVSRQSTSSTTTLLVLKYSSNENQSHRRQDEIKLTDHSSVQLPRDEQMQSQHNNIDVNH